MNLVYFINFTGKIKSKVLRIRFARYKVGGVYFINQEKKELFLR